MFTVDTFPDNEIHFLDIKIDENNTDIYYKDTHTGQYTDFNSFVPWSLRISWVRSLYNRAKGICTTKESFDRQILNIQKFMSWNGFTRRFRNTLLKKLQYHNPSTHVENEEKENQETTIWLRIPYVGNCGVSHVKRLLSKIKRNLKTNINVKFKVFYNTKKLSFHYSNKDRVPEGQRACVIYQITCPGCGGNYIGETERCVSIRLNEHGTKINEPMNRHLRHCNLFNEVVQLFYQPSVFNDRLDDFNFNEHIRNAVLNNYEIIDTCVNWSQLLFLEAFYIKKLNPAINKGLKASKELILFK